MQKWGNSLGIRIPLALTQKIGLREGNPVGLQVDEDAIIIRRKHYSLEQLLAQVTPDNNHSEIDTGPQVGREV
ncbi:AbrB/MazE/SpoVT family DNA-binding domain-containing protein [Moorella sulfitireducens]|uniref:AbrB/MazE/SpoVT family DNA-binding domain-containing protein n=1 Tax=Neomoorella sulfitireducens TaxID=2972948 RepID=UPI0021AD19C1